MEYITKEDLLEYINLLNDDGKVETEYLLKFLGGALFKQELSVSGVNINVPTSINEAEVLYKISDHLYQLKELWDYHYYPNQLMVDLSDDSYMSDLGYRIGAKIKEFYIQEISNYNRGLKISK